jgi:hypothetical protein
MRQLSRCIYECSDKGCGSDYSGQNDGDVDRAEHGAQLYSRHVSQWVRE